MPDDETTQDPEATEDDRETASEDLATVDASGTIDPKAAKSRPIEPKPHVRE